MKQQYNYLENIFKINSKKVIITGSTGKLGKILCKSYLELGAKVIGIDYKLDKKNLIVHSNVNYIKADISDKKSINKVFKDIYKKNKNIDILINNAAVSCFETFDKRSEKNFDSTMAVNLKGTFFCIKQFAKLHNKKFSANIINIASIYGLISPDFRIYSKGDRINSEIYGATKAGIIQMTKYFGVFLANQNIRVNAVSPGGIFDKANPQKKSFIKKYSYRNPMNRMGNYKDIVGAIVYLSSDAASYTTGQNIIIDGGMSSW